jgi:hypothetical protein
MTAQRRVYSGGKGRLAVQAQPGGVPRSRRRHFHNESKEARPPEVKDSILRLNRTAIFGALTGALSAPTVYLPIGNFPGIVIFGACIGLVSSGSCDGLVLGTYLGPGLIFGLVFGFILHRAGRVSRAGAGGFALASLIANGLAVMSAVNAYQFLHPLFGKSELAAEAIAGLIAGAVGGGALGRVTAILVPGLRWHRLLGAGAGLGLLLPLALDESLGPPGLYAFYILWQGGYAAALATARRGA